MNMQNRQTNSPSSQLRYKLLLAYCLMSLMPILVGIYIASMFITYPFDVSPMNLAVVSLVTFFSISLSFLGYKVTKQLTEPIVGMSHVARNIAEGRLDDSLEEVKGAEELEELSESLKTISKNAKELIKKVESLSLKDSLTGLYNASYLRERLNEEIQRAIHYQQPCALLYLSIDNFDEIVSKNGVKASEEALKSVATLFQACLSELDRAGRISKSDFAMILPDRNKKKAIEIAERIQKEIKGLPGIAFTACIGISENPMDGTLSEELFSKAKERVKSARLHGTGVIEALR